MPSAKEQIADHLANPRVRSLIERPSQARRAKAAQASTPTRRVMAMSRCRDGQMPGRGETRPNPVFCAMPIHPDRRISASYFLASSTLASVERGV